MNIDYVFQPRSDYKGICFKNGNIRVNLPEFETAQDILETIRHEELHYGIMISTNYRLSAKKEHFAIKKVLFMLDDCL